jgi:hypothetical protein
MTGDILNIEEKALQNEVAPHLAHRAHAHPGPGGPATEVECERVFPLSEQHSLTRSVCCTLRQARSSRRSLSYSAGSG